MKNNTEILREWTEEDWDNALSTPGICPEFEYVRTVCGSGESAAGVSENLVYINNTDNVALIVKGLDDIIKLGPSFKLSEINSTICAELMLLLEAVHTGAMLALSNVFTAMKVMKGENDDKNNGTQESQNMDNQANL